MANTQTPAVTFDQLIQEGRKKKAAENLAQKLLGKGRRSSAPPSGPKSPSLTGSLASRVGVSKPRNSSIPRGPRPSAAPLTRMRSDVILDSPSRPSSTRPEVGSRSSSSAIINGGGLSIRGAASSGTGSPVIVAQNFAPGTTAADIESVMLKVGGEMSSCRLVASVPTVIAEMVFVEPAGAENVIEQFNGKKADGRTLYVYRRDDGGARRSTVANTSAPLVVPEPIPISSENDAMMVDEAAEAREANDRMREERRGRDDRERERERPRDDERDVFPSGPRNYRDYYYDRGGPRRSEGGYRDGQYGFGGGRGGGGRDGYAPRGPGGGRYDGRERGYGGGGRGWR